MQSKASEHKIRLDNEQRLNKKLQAQVRELRKELDNQNQIMNNDSSDLNSAASKDQVMQNIKVLIKSSRKQIEEVEDTLKRLMRHQLELTKQIENLEIEKKDVMEKEQIRLDDEDTDLGHAKFEQ